MKILIVSPIDPAALEELRRRHDVVCCFNASRQQLGEAIRDREVLVFRSGVSITAESLSAAPHLKLLVRAGCGLDNIDLDAVDVRGLQLTRITRPAAQAVSEMALALMFSLARRVLEADSSMRRGEWAKYRLSGRLLFGNSLGIVGAGNIGGRLGQLAAAIGMKVQGCVEHPSPQVADELLAKGIRLASFAKVIGSADFLAITVPLQESTRKLIDRPTLEAMKPGSFLVNLSRGGVVDESALYQNLRKGQGLAGAALDVHQLEGEGQRSPLADLSNVVLTPHIGSMTADTQAAIGQEILDVIDAFAAKRAA